MEIVADGDATHAPGFPALTNGGVVDVATQRQYPLEQSLLFWRRIELVFVHFADARLFHTPLFCPCVTQAAIYRRHYELLAPPSFHPHGGNRGGFNWDDL